jgi:hypothetical protein
MDRALALSIFFISILLNTSITPIAMVLLKTIEISVRYLQAINTTRLGD